MEDIDDIRSALNRAKMFITRLIFAYRSFTDYHTDDFSVLIYRATCLNITIPPYIEEKVKKFLLRSLDSDHERLSFQDTMVGVSYLLLKGHKPEKLNDILDHIFSFQNEDGGIGTQKGDISRIPNTGHFMTLVLSRDYLDEETFRVYEPRIVKACNFLIDEWNKDVSQHCALSYKGTHVLNTLQKCQDVNLEIPNLHTETIKTVEVLLDMQLENGSWSFLPKKTDKRILRELPAPNTTASVLLSLCGAYLKEKHTPIVGRERSKNLFEAIGKGSTYLCNTQTEPGFWYAHDAGELSSITAQSALALKKCLEVYKNEQ
jgi:hypothetical protein